MPDNVETLSWALFLIIEILITLAITLGVVTWGVERRMKMVTMLHTLSTAVDEDTDPLEQWLDSTAKRFGITTDTKTWVPDLLMTIASALKGTPDVDSKPN